MSFVIQPQWWLQVCILGVGATLILDAWWWLLKRMFSVASLDFRLVGRWLGHMPAGRFRHAAIGSTPAVRGELWLGWGFHYVTGIAFAAGFVCIAGEQWLHSPRFLPALVFGVTTVVLPFFIMQPCLGAGVAASKLPSPWRARLKSLVTHSVFGLGLYLSALLHLG